MMTTPPYVRQAHLSWLPGAYGTPPPANAVQAAAGICIIRGRKNEDLIPGKMPIGIGAGFIPYKGEEFGLREFEILCNTNVYANQALYNWVPARDGQVPAGAFLAGITGSGEPLYIARATVNDEVCVGKVNRLYKCALLPWGNKEYKLREYDVLCCLE
ncbi:unnamed protein product [Trichobilharzia szidati]|nr:unnamed protein product [Trichobilharzia szidati]